MAPKNSWLKALRLQKVTGVVVLVVLIILFSAISPHLFATVYTLRTVLNEQAVTVAIAVALLIPFAAGAFDLSIGYTMGLGALLSAYLMADKGLPVGVAVVLTLVAGALIGIVNGLIVTGIGVDSFIATLGTGSIIAGLITLISGNQYIPGVPTSYEQFASSEFLGLTLPVWLVLVIAIVAWYVLDLTRLGRYIYATGGNIEAARLSGVRTSRIVFGSLVASGIGGTIAGLIITAQLDSGSPSVGPDYLLPSFAAVFLGATQFRVGRPNVWGTVLAVFVIAVGIKGLSIIGAPLYVGSIFDGAALIIAVSLTVLTNRRTGLAARMLPARFRRARVDIPSDDADGPAEVGAELPGETAGSQVRAEQ